MQNCGIPSLYALLPVLTAAGLIAAETERGDMR